MSQQVCYGCIRCPVAAGLLNIPSDLACIQESKIYMDFNDRYQVNSPLSGQSIDRSNPSSSYTTSYLQHTFNVVEAFKSYPNTLAFFAGNEIINDVDTGNANPPYIRAVLRDIKNYVRAHATRAIPVGYSAADVRSVLQDTWAYLQCNNSANGDSNSAADFLGLNSYSWCGSASNFQTSGYDQLVSIFSNTSIPVFLSECVQ